MPRVDRLRLIGLSAGCLAVLAVIVGLPAIAAYAGGLKQSPPSITISPVECSAAGGSGNECQQLSAGALSQRVVHSAKYNGGVQQWPSAQFRWSFSGATNITEITIQLSTPRSNSAWPSGSCSAGDGAVRLDLRNNTTVLGTGTVIAANTYQWSIPGGTQITDAYMTSHGCQLDYEARTYDFTWTVITINGEAVDETPTPTFSCPTDHPAGLLYDNDMEQRPNSDHWDPFSDDQADPEKFGRIGNSLMERITWGSAFCGTAMHHTGVWDFSMLFQRATYSSDISQEFCWDGGDLFWSAAARGGDGSWPGDPFIPEAQVIITGNGQNVIANETIESVWTTLGGSIPELAPGMYTMRLGMHQPNIDPFDPTSGADKRPYVLWDNIQLAKGAPPAASYCSGNYLPPGSTTTTPTAQISPTPTCVPYELQGPCGFEDGNPGGWQSVDGASRPWHHQIFGDVYFVSYRNANGDPGALIYIGDFTKCGDGKLYLNFYAWGIWRIRIRDTRTGAYYADFSGGTIQQWVWRQYAYQLDIPEGQYEIIISALQQQGVFFDNFAIGAGQQTVCSAAVGTNTPGPTRTYTPPATSSFTPTGTLPASSTPTRTVSPTPSRTAIPSLTPWPSYTPPPPSLTPTNAPSRTPTVTHTMPPTDTQAPTDTVPPGSDTSTPRPTNTPRPTITVPPPDEPTPTYIPPNPPQQPPPACYAPCVRPWAPAYQIYLGDNIFEVGLSLVRLDTLWYIIRYTTGYAISYLGGWADYARCSALSYIAWCPEHTREIIAIQSDFAGREPFGTIKEFQESYTAVQTVVAQYNWAETGVEIGGTPIANDTSPNWDSWKVEGTNSPYNGGRIDITGGEQYITGESTTTCSFGYMPWVGPYLSQGMCFAWSTLDRLGVLAWYQACVNSMAFLMLVMYVTKRWINAGAHG